MVPYLPRELFLTKGVGRHKERLASFEEALRDAKIARFNLTHVSSIYPPYCKIVPVNRGLVKLQSGQVIAVVIAAIGLTATVIRLYLRRPAWPFATAALVLCLIAFFLGGVGYTVAVGA